MSRSLRPSRDVPIRPVACPNCNQVEDRMSCFAGEEPEPGRFVLRGHCGALSVILTDGGLRPATAAEKFRIFLSEEGPLIERALDQIKARRGTKP